MRAQGSGFGVQNDSPSGGRALLLTPPGGAAIAVVRLVGRGVAPFLARHFSKPLTGDGRCVHGVLSDGGRVIDDPLVVYRAESRAAEINLHGGPWVVRSVFELARRSGFEIVERPGLPLPDDAVDAGNELGREVLRYLPMARTQLAARVLLAQEGAWQELLLPQPRGGGGTIPAVLEDRSLHWLLHPPRVAVVGVPNVGKSTLANQLFAQERSITADQPGTTRDWVGEIANLDGLAVTLVDTPGLRETTDPIEREAIGRGHREIERADLVVVVLDPTQAPDGQRNLIRAHPNALAVVNKADRPATWEVADGAEAIPTVATTGEGMDALRLAIKRRFLGTTEIDTHRPRWWTRRQRGILERALTDPAALAEL